MFLERVNNHPRANLLYDPSHFVLQQLDYLQYIDFYHDRIRMFHVKDAEFNPTGKPGVYGGFQNWIDRAGRFRSLGDGQVDFGGIFSQAERRTALTGWAVLEWECRHQARRSRRRSAKALRSCPSHIIQRHRQGLRRFRLVGDRQGGQPQDPRHLS